MKKEITKDEAMERMWFSVITIAGWIAEGTKDGKKKMEVWEWYKWFRREIRKRYHR